MKEKILTLIIGALIGAIITTGVFLIINKNNSNTNQTQNGKPDMSQMNGNMQGNIKGMKGQKNLESNSTDSNSTATNYNGLQGDMGEPPEMPNGEAPSGEMQNGNRPQGKNASSNKN